MRYSLIIWDFNGTILDDLDLSFNSINTVLKKRGLPTIQDKESYRKKFGFPIENYYARLGMDFSKEPYNVPADEWVKLYSDGKNNLGLTEGVEDVINHIASNNIPQWILSASEMTLLTEQLTKLNIIDKFSCILGCDNVYGRGKVDLAKDFARKYNTDLSSSVLIGDTDHDYQTASALGCYCILFDQGHMDKQRLCATGATIIHSMSQLFDIL